MEKIIVREIKIWLAALVIGLTMSLLIAYTRAYAENVQNEIADNVIRFHVLANSDSVEDQELKNIVQKGIRARFSKELGPHGSLEESRKTILAGLDEIEHTAAKLVEKNGFDYPVKVALGRTFFPSVDYGDISFPAGEYEALRIIIGEGKGGNWWCVMFPPLCYLDAASPDSALSDLLSDDTYNLMNHSKNGAKVTVRFKVVEWWQERMNTPVYFANLPPNYAP